MTRVAVLSAFLALACGNLLAQDKFSPSRFEKEISAFEAADKEKSPPQGAILFIGASGIKRWTTLSEDFPDHKVINRGFGGSHIADSTYFAERVIFPYKPRLIVFQAGGNDLNGGKSPQQVSDDFAVFVKKVRGALPDVRIVYLSIGPSPARWSQADKQKETNALIKKQIDAGQNMAYCNSYEGFLNSDGQPREELFVSDRLHHNAAGYKVRADQVRPFLTMP
jgi:lysophospholipase L1-like esterase